MIIYLISKNPHQVSLIQFVKKDLLKGYSCTSDCAKAKRFRTTDEAEKVKTKISAIYGDLYDAKIADSILNLEPHQFYIIRTSKGKYYSGQERRNGKLSPVFDKNISKAIVYQLERYGAADTFSKTVIGSNIRAFVGHIFLNRINPYFAQKYVITCEDRNNKDRILFLKGGTGNDPVTTNKSDDALFMDIEQALDKHEALLAQCKGFKYSVIPKPDVCVNSLNLLDYLKSHSWDRRINAGGGSLESYGKANITSANT